MIIEKSLDKFLLSIILDEYSSRNVIRAIETLPQRTEGIKPMIHILNSLNSLANFKSGVLQFDMYSRVYTSNAYLVSLFSIDFVYDFFKSIVDACPSTNQLTTKVLLSIFKDSYADYAKEVDMNTLKTKMPELNEAEILYIPKLVNQFLEENLSSLSRVISHATIK